LIGTPFHVEPKPLPMGTAVIPDSTPPPKFGPLLCLRGGGGSLMIAGSSCSPELMLALGGMAARE
jgi:hypothetical protein